MATDSDSTSPLTNDSTALGETKSLGWGPTIYFLITFLFAVGCFAWLAYSNADSPRSPSGGRQITYYPPFYCLLAVVGQLFLALPFLIRRAAKIRQ